MIEEREYLADLAVELVEIERKLRRGPEVFFDPNRREDYHARLWKHRSDVLQKMEQTVDSSRERV